MTKFKTIITSILIIGIFSFSSYAQTSYGLNTGQSFIIGKENNQNWNIGYVQHLGGMIAFYINEDIQFQTGLSFERIYQKKYFDSSSFSNSNDVAIDASNEISFKVFNLNLPLLVRFNISSHSKIYSGVYLGYQLGHKNEGRDKSFRFDPKAPINTFNTGLHIAYGYRFNKLELITQLDMEFRDRFSSAPYYNSNTLFIPGLSLQYNFEKK